MRAFAALLVLQAAAAQRTDFDKITCPVVGTFVKSGLLVPDADGLITREQTLAAFLAQGVPEDIAVATTNGNFFSAACEVCPPTIDPFEMNVMGQGDVSSPPQGPQEHFRSTGIREGPHGGPEEGVFLFGEAVCLGGKAAWTRDDVECFTDLWDREQGCSGIAFSNDVDELKRPEGCMMCESRKRNPACQSALFDTIMFMFESFKTDADSFEKEAFRAMWIDLEFPTPLPVVLFEDTFAAPTPGAAWWVSGWQSGLKNEQLRLRKDHSARLLVPLPAATKHENVQVSFDFQTVNAVAGVVGLAVTARFGDEGPWFTIGHHLTSEGALTHFEHTMAKPEAALDVRVRFTLSGSSLDEKVRLDNVALRLVA